MKTSESEREVIVAALMGLVEPLSQLVPDSEVVLQDLSRLPNSIVAIAGELTGRQVGDPATDTLLKQAAGGEVRTRLNYRSVLPDGRQVRSTTIAVKDSSGHSVAALCINSDITRWLGVEQVLRPLIDGVAAAAAEDCDENELFVHSVEDLSELILQRAIGSQGVAVTAMSREQKKDVIRQAQAQGFFLMRDAAGTLAERLEVSRFTVYNYLKEIEGER